MICFFLKDTATTEIYIFSLHDSLPVSGLGAPAGDLDAVRLATRHGPLLLARLFGALRVPRRRARPPGRLARLRGAVFTSEEHTSELQSRQYLGCSLLLDR